MLWLLRKPSNDRDWTPENAVAPRVEIDGDRIVVRGVRCFRYRSTRDYDPAWEDREYRLDALDSLDFFIAPFSLRRGSDREGGVAHTFVSFGFGGEHLAVSIEVRRTRGKSYNPLHGLFRCFELIYVFADERDAVGVRTAYTRSNVYLYPVNASRDKMRSMFIEMAMRANELHEKPEFYNTLCNTCTTNLVRHVNTISPGRIPWSPYVLLPGYSTRLLYRLGLIGTDAPLEEITERARISDEAGAALDDADFSELIRGRGQSRPGNQPAA